MHPQRLRRWLYVGQFTPCKGPDVVAKVINRVFPQFPHLEMTWVTERAHHDQVWQVVLPELRERLRVQDWVKQEELVSIYDQHGIYVFPSYFEGFAKTFLEAMARGLCVVASAVDGMRQTIRSGENGLSAAAGDVDGLAAQAVRLLNDWQLAHQVSMAARATALSYTWERSVETLVAFYEQLLDRKTQTAWGHQAVTQ